MIQSAQVASKFTLFTHHAKTFPNLITALRNSMLRAGVFKDEKTAEEQVVQVLNFDIHLLKDFRGRRYIERITECVPVEEKNEYTFDHRKEKTLEGKLDKFMDNTTIFFSKTTNRELYKHHNVLEFSNDTYVLTNPISDLNIREMRNNMDDMDIGKFDAFLERNWGIKPPKMPEMEGAIKEVPKVIQVKDDVPVENETVPTSANSENREQKIENRPTGQPGVNKPNGQRPVGQARPNGQPNGGQRSEVGGQKLGTNKPVGNQVKRPMTPNGQPGANRPAGAPVKRPMAPNGQTNVNKPGQNNTPQNKPSGTNSILDGINLEDDDE